MSDNQEMNNYSEGNGRWSHHPAMAPMYPPPLAANDGPPAPVGGPPQGNYNGPPAPVRGPPPQRHFDGPPAPVGGPPQGHYNGPPAPVRGPPPQRHYDGPPAPVGGPPQGHYNGPPASVRGPPQGHYDRPPAPVRGPPQGHYDGPPAHVRGPPQGRYDGPPAPTGGPSQGHYDGPPTTTVGGPPQVCYDGPSASVGGPPPQGHYDGPPARVRGPPQGCYGMAPRLLPGMDTSGNFPLPYRGPPPRYFPGAVSPSADLRGPPPPSDFGDAHGRPPIAGHLGQLPPVGNYERSPSLGRFRGSPPVGNYTRPPPINYGGPPPIRNQVVPTGTGNVVGTDGNESCGVPSSVVNSETNYEVASCVGASGHTGPPPPSGRLMGWEPPTHPRTMPDSRSSTQQVAVQNENIPRLNSPPGVRQAPPGKTFPATNLVKPTHSFGHIPHSDLSRLSSKRELNLNHSNDQDIAMAKTAELDGDQKWIKDFEDRITYRKTETIDNAGEDRIRKLSDAQDMLENSFILLHNMEQLRDEMSLKKKTAKEEEWSCLVQQAKNIKRKLEKLQRCIQNESVMQALKQLIIKRRKKRIRTRNRRNRKKEEKKLMQLAWDKEEEKINAWKEKIEQEELEKRREKAVQLEADSILGEVRQKQSEGVRMQQLLMSLHTLRQARINKGSDHGYVSSQKEDFHFASTQRGINEVVAAQLKEYELEEQTLRVMMGESSTLNKPQRNETCIIINRQEGALKKVLFGHLSTTEDFTSAKESWEALLQRRMEWDQYVTQEETPLASAIPVSWVLPPVQPSTEWAQFQCVRKEK